MAATLEEPKMGEHLFLTPKVPQGLAAAVEGLTREVIRQRPDNIYSFAARHFEKLLQLREQYDVENKANNNNNEPSREASCGTRGRRAELRDISEAIRERQQGPPGCRRHGCCGCPGGAEPAEHCPKPSGWSLNEAAKVLERHRSIFGDSGQKLSAEQVRELASRAEPTASRLPTGRCGSQEREPQPKPPARKRDSDESSGSSGRRAGPPARPSPPKIMSQIPLAKDIKTELRKHRRSSKADEKQQQQQQQQQQQRVHACSDKRTETTTTETKKSVEKTRRSLEIIRSEQRKSSSRSTESISIKRKTDVIVRDKPAGPRRATEPASSPFSSSASSSSSSKPSGMDRVKNHTVQSFASMSSIEELQSPSYVEKVQEVINETSTIIKEKVEALKTDFVKLARSKKHSKKERSSNTEDQSNFVDKSAKKEKKSREAASSAASSSSTPSSSSSSSSTSRHSNKKPDEVPKSGPTAQKNPSPDPAASTAQRSEAADGSHEPKISLPAVRPPSSKSSSRSASARSNSAEDGLILPPITPESAKSTKVKEELVLPALSPPHSSAVTPDSLNSDADKNSSRNKGFYDEEEFQDSLNVTPDLLDEQQRPDSLEPPDVHGADKRSDGHGSPVETLRDKLMEIRDAQKRIEGVLHDTVGGDHKPPQRAGDAGTGGGSAIQDKLKEIQDSEKRIEKILDSQSATVDVAKGANVDIKKKLEELEDVGKRIESIIDGKTEEKLTRDEVNSTNIHVGQESKQSSSGVDSIKRDTKNSKETDAENKRKKQSDSAIKGGESKEYKETIEARREVLSPYSYILTEGSPHEIPDSVTTVIIPDRTPSPDSESFQLQLEDEQIYATLVSSPTEAQPVALPSAAESEPKRKTSIHDAFGEAVEGKNQESSTVDTDYDQAIRASHDSTLPARQSKDLDLIKEERDRETEETEAMDSEDEKVLKVVTSSLEEILEKDKLEYVAKEEVESLLQRGVPPGGDESLSPPRSKESDKPRDEGGDSSVAEKLVEAVDGDEHSLDIERATLKSTTESITDEFKETSIASDRSSSLLDQFTMPVVPELNLDSLPDLTISSFDEQKDEKQEDLLKELVASEIPLDSERAKYAASLDATNGRLETTSVQSSRVAQSSGKVEEKFSGTLIESKEVDITKDASAIEVAEKSQSSEETQEESKTEVTKDAAIEVAEKLQSIEETRKESTTGEMKDGTIKVAEQSQSKEEIAKESEEKREMEKTSDCTLRSKSDTVESSSEVSGKTTTVIAARQGSLAEERQLTESASKLPAGAASSTSLDDKLTGGRAVDPAQGIASSRAINEGKPGAQTTEQSASQKESRNAPARERANSESSAREPAEPETEEKRRRGGERQRREPRPENDGIDENDRSGQSAESIDPPALEPGAGSEGNRSARPEAAGQRVARRKIERQATYDKSSGEERETPGPEAPSAPSAATPAHFLASVTKLQAGVRGFLARRRLHAAQCRGSTLDSVPSIQESEPAVERRPYVTDSSSSSKSEAALLSLLSVVGVTKSMAELKRTAQSRKKLTRGDALQRKTLSLENAFAEGRLQHTGEFHDCIPLPVFDLGLKVSASREPERQEQPPGPGPKSGPGNVEQLLSKILLGPAPGVAKLSPFVDVVLLPGDTEAMLQSGYLNFITSVEDVFSETLTPSDTPKGVIIEEITSLDEERLGRAAKASPSEQTGPDSSRSDAETTSDASDGRKGKASARISSSSSAASGELGTDKAATDSQEPSQSEPRGPKQRDDLLERAEEDGTGSLTSAERGRLAAADGSPRAKFAARVAPAAVASAAAAGMLQSLARPDAPGGAEGAAGEDAEKSEARAPLGPDKQAAGN